MLEGVSEAVAGLEEITEEEELEQLTVEGRVQVAVQGGGLLGELIRLLVDMDRIIPRYLQTKPAQPQTHADTQAAVHYPNPPPVPSSDSVTTTTPHPCRAQLPPVWLNVHMTQPNSLLSRLYFATLTLTTVGIHIPAHHHLRPLLPPPWTLIPPSLTRRNSPGRI